MEIFNEEGDFSRDFFIFMKYNIIPSEDNTLSDTDEKLYDEFVRKVRAFKEKIENDSDSAKAIAASIFSMFGYSRHYCAMTGQPIIGKFYKLNGKIVSKEAYEAHKIIKEIEGFDNKIQAQNHPEKPKAKADSKRRDK